VTYPSSRLEGSIVARPREGHRRRSSEADKRRILGDIGTSPLYTLKTVLDLTGGSAPAAVLGVLSLMVWTLIAITSIKYVAIAMRIVPTAGLP
jgi:hypothetical protein